VITSTTELALRLTSRDFSTEARTPVTVTVSVSVASLVSLGAPVCATWTPPWSTARAGGAEALAGGAADAGADCAHDGDAPPPSASATAIAMGLSSVFIVSSWRIAFDRFDGPAWRASGIPHPRPIYPFRRRIERSGRAKLGNIWSRPVRHQCTTNLAKLVKEI
jgi:hypothetical protein